MVTSTGVRRSVVKVVELASSQRAGSRKSFSKLEEEEEQPVAEVTMHEVERSKVEGEEEQLHGDHVMLDAAHLPPPAPPAPRTSS